MVPPLTVRVPLFDMPCELELLTVPLLIVRVAELLMPFWLPSMEPPFTVRLPLVVFDIPCELVLLTVPLLTVRVPLLLMAFWLPCATC